MALPNTFTDNTSNLIQAGDFGIRISQPGYDARTTASNNLIFSSSWPSLQIAFSQYGAANAVVPHNLGFPPFTIVWLPPSANTFLSYPFTAASVDDTNIYLGDGTGVTGTDYGWITAYNIDLSKDIDYPTLPSPSPINAYDNNYGIKIAKQGQSIASKDMRDFILHSRCRSPLVLAVKTEATSSPANPTVVQYTSQLGFPSWNFGFVKDSSGKYRWAAMYGQAYPVTFSDGTTSYIQYDAPDVGATLVVLRDPLFAPNIESVTY